MSIRSLRRLQNHLNTTEISLSQVLRANPVVDTTCITPVCTKNIVSINLEEKLSILSISLVLCERSVSL